MASCYFMTPLQWGAVWLFERPKMVHCCNFQKLICTSHHHLMKLNSEFCAYRTKWCSIASRFWLLQKKFWKMFLLNLMNVHLHSKSKSVFLGRVDDNNLIHLLNCDKKAPIISGHLTHIRSHSLSMPLCLSLYVCICMCVSLSPSNQNSLLW